MGYHLQPAPADPDTVIEPPRNDHNQPYRWCMYYRGDTSLAFADTPTDLLSVLLPGYLDLDTHARAVARIELATAAASIIQGHVLAETHPEDLTPEDRAILTAPRIGPNAPTPNGGNRPPPWCWSPPPIPPTPTFPAPPAPSPTPPTPPTCGGCAPKPRMTC